jgi:hypothetical protein
MDTFNRLVTRVRTMIAYEISVREIHSTLISEGCDEGQAYLLYKAAQVLAF